jgi:hypothetical protein
MTDRQHIYPSYPSDRGWDTYRVRSGKVVGQSVMLGALSICASEDSYSTV